jgi:metal-sulfur cluster biosynthetic enzyme
MIDNEKVLEILKNVIDPELGINIVDLGLVYGIDVFEDQSVKVTMTLTTPGCPLHNTIETAIMHELKEATGHTNHIVELVWEPQWTPEMMSQAAKEALWGGR